MAPRKRTVNPSRSIEQEVKSDSKARNLLTVSSKNYQNAGKKTTKPTINRKTATPISLLKNKKKKVRTYTEKELDIPKLNRSIDPEGVKRPRGKKGKVFADNDTMLRILHTVNEKVDNTNASKLEKARQLEEIRESKRREIERKEQDKEEKLSKMKTQLKKRKKNKASELDDSSERSSRKKVSFA